VPDVLQDTFEVELDGERYTFKAPSIRYRFEVGGRSADIRRRGSPEAYLNERNGTIDWSVDSFSRSCAVLELYLVKATCAWPYGAGSVAEIDPTKLPKVDFEKFPPGKEDTIDALAAAFSEGLARFRTGGDTDGRSAGAQAVDGVGGAGSP
jgi:hypothetical protein